MTDEQESAPLSEAGRVVNVFLDPKRAFGDIAARPRPWVPLVLAVVLASAFMTVYSQRVGWSRMFEQQVERNPQVQNMTPEQRARVSQMNATMAAVMDKAGMLIPVVTVPFYVLLVSAVLALIFRVMMSAEVTFRQLFGITAYGFLPDILYWGSAIAVLFFKPPDEFDLENPVALNLGAFLDPQQVSKSVMALAGSIDIFTFWKMLLLAVGISVASRKVSFGKAVAGIFIPWIVWVLIKTGLAALRG